jgi:hypothetical protein
MGIFEKDDGKVESEQPVVHDYEKQHPEHDYDAERFEDEGGAPAPDPEPEPSTVTVKLRRNFIGSYRDRESEVRFRRGEAKEVDAETADRLLEVVDRNGQKAFVRVTD